MSNSTAYATLGNDIAECVKPQRRSRMRVVTTPLAIDPDWDHKIDDDIEARRERVKQNFKASPFLLASFYEFLGLLPSEIKDIDDHVRQGNARGALVEIDDMIDKMINWRIKLSHLVSIEKL